MHRGREHTSCERRTKDRDECRECRHYAALSRAIWVTRRLPLYQRALDVGLNVLRILVLPARKVSKRHPAARNALQQRVSVNLRRVVEIGVTQELLDTARISVRDAAPTHPSAICLSVIAGFQDFSSLRMLRQMVPDG